MPLLRGHIPTDSATILIVAEQQETFIFALTASASKHIKQEQKLLLGQRKRKIR